MSQQKPVHAWVISYGAWDPSIRTPIEAIGHHQYLNGIVQSLAPVHDRLVGITVCGGQPDALGRTECSTVAPELTKRLAAAGITNVSCDLDEASTSALAIAKKVAAFVCEHPDTHPLLFVDAVRYETSLYLLGEYCTKLGCADCNPRAVIVPIERIDEHPNSTPEAQAKKLAEMREKGIDVLEQELTQ